MRSFLLFLFVLGWVSACIGCGTRPAPETPTRVFAAQLTSETVALVHLVNDDGDEDPNGKPRILCSGVFVTPSVILTAGHCTSHLGGVGSDAYWAMQSDGEKYRTGFVFAEDLAEDLGAIRIRKPYPPHPYAHVSASPIEVGDRAYWVGHPIGYAWSYAEGYVSAYRPDEQNSHGFPMATLQLAGPTSPGNSGSGAFDRNGRLIGICSYLGWGVNGMGFFVARNAVRVFLADAGVPL